MFYVGQKVVCVDARETDYGAENHLYLPGMDGLTKGLIYTVAEVLVWTDNKLCIRVVEIVRRPPNGPYWAHRFRPVVERKTDISVFTALLQKSKEPA